MKRTALFVTVLSVLLLAAGLQTAAWAVAAAETPAAAPAEQTLTGSLTCAKCALKETAECQTVLQVKDGDKTVNYYLADNDVAKAYHKKVCHAAQQAKVIGTVAEVDGKKILTATTIAKLQEGHSHG